MKKLYIALLAVTAISAIAVSSLIFIVPDHSGELRMDLRPGDYYVLAYGNDGNPIRYEIVSIDEDGILTVDVTKWDGDAETTKMTKTIFFRYIYFDTSNSPGDHFRRAIIDTQHGKRMCTLYNQDLNNYWVDGNNVIYRSFVGGTIMVLTDTNLIIT